MKTRTTLYDLLGLPPTATEADIHAAQLRLVRHYQSGPHGMDQVDADNQIKVVKEASWILSDPGRRAAYDASLAPTQPELPPGLGVPAGVLPVDLPPPRVFKPRPPLRTMLTVIGGLLAVAVGIQIFMSIFAFRQMSPADNGAMNAAQARAAAAERRQIYGDLTDEEIARQATEERRRREAYQQAEAERRAEYERREAERRHEMALAERKQYADQITNSVQRAEEEARRKAEWERQQKEARDRAEEAREQARLEQRLARERARLGMGSGY